MICGKGITLPKISEMIKNLVFDFGGVLLPIDEGKTRKAFKNLGAKESLAEQNETFQKFEKGEINTKQFEKALQSHFFRKVFLNDIGDAWNELIIQEIPEENIHLLKRLKSDYRIFLLSNTNALHIQAVKDKSGPFTYTHFKAQFEKAYYSFEIGKRKPDANIFEFVLEENNLKAEETFYIDDSEQHIASAENLGIHTWCFKPGEDNLSDLDKVLSKLHL